MNTRYDYELKALKPIDISYYEVYRNGMDVTAPEDEIQHSIMKWLHKEGDVEYKKMLSIANDEQRPILLKAIKRFEEELSKLPESEGETLNDSINIQYRNLAVKYRKIFNEIMG